MSIKLKTPAIFLSAILISACAANRVQNFRTGDHLPRIKSEHIREQAVACKSARPQHAVNINKVLRSGHLINAQYNSPVFLAFRKAKYSGAAIKKRNKQVNSSKELIPIVENTAENGRRLDDLRKDVKVIQYIKGIETNNQDLIEKPDLLSLIKLKSHETFAAGFKKSTPEDILIPAKLKFELNPLTLSFLKKDEQENLVIKKLQKEKSDPVIYPLKTNQPQKQPFNRNEILVYLLTLFAGSLSFAGLKAVPNIAWNMSFWAAMNPLKARVLITGIHSLTAFSGIIIGKQLTESGIHFSNLSPYLLTGTFLTSALFYPVRNSQKKLFRRTYLRQKIHDLALFLTGFMLMINVGNQNFWATPSLDKTADKSGGKQINGSLFNNKIPTPHQLVYFMDENRIQDEIPIPENQERSKGMKIFLTVLAVLGLCALAFGLIALSCYIYCSGLEAIAFIVGIGGGVLLSALFVWVVRKIFNPEYKRRPKSYKV